MGEEYGEKSPFQYFVSHSDPGLVEAVRQGRKQEFPDFIKDDEFPDPQSEETFKRSCLNWSLRNKPDHQVLLEFYRTLLNLRKTIPALADLSKKRLWTQVDKETNILFMHREKDLSQVCVVMNFSNRLKKQKYAFPSGLWRKVCESSESRWNGPGSRAPKQVSEEKEIELNPWSFCVYKKGES
jgi:maltooligosyltrehalose trehalohydrolase